MANGNGNNNNADDAAAAAATATTTQHLTGDGSGACGDAKQSTAAAVATSATTTRGSSVNDLVADLWLNGSSGSCSRGDYTNIRATTTIAAAPAATSSAAASTSSSTTSSSTFSFKHFLNSSGTVTAPSSTVTSLDAATSTSTSTSASTSLQTSTGARPKVPQSASISQMQSDLNGSSSSCSSSAAAAAASKMKRSPRFSSFDSQASLAEYAASGSSGVGNPNVNVSSSSCSGSGNTRLRQDLRLEVDPVLDDNDDDDHLGLAQVRNSRLYDERVDDDIFPSAASNLQSRYVPRSYSSYDMPPRRRPALRPNRLVLAATPKMKLDLPLDTSNVAGGGGGAASALPDFVQDHLSDAWCQEAQLSSPPNSPLSAAEAPSCSGAALGAMHLAAAGSAGLPSGTAAIVETATGKMLPDFLSDGPILHSSQRLADVAIGLPSNSIDSPPQEQQEGSPDGNTVSTLRQENERLQRQLQETRVELNAQTRRSQDFEQQLLVLTDARRRDILAANVQAQNVQRLRRQVSQLESELFALRDDSVQMAASAAGVAHSSPSSSSSLPSSVMTPQGTHNHTHTSRPSRSHQLSRDLLRAADNAEQNLRQLLAGVDNLRQMAANLEQPSAPAATPRSPNSDPYSGFN